MSTFGKLLDQVLRTGDIVPTKIAWTAAYLPSDTQ
jgi:hypothetical protein